MPYEELFDLAWEDVFAAANDHFFEASYDVKVALRVHCCQIPRVQPSLAINRRVGRVFHLVVARHDLVAPAAEFSALLTGDEVAGRRIDQLDLAVGQRQTHCCRFPFKWIVRQCFGNKRAGFSLTKEVTHVGPHTLCHLFYQGDRD